MIGTGGNYKHDLRSFTTHNFIGSYKAYMAGASDVIHIIPHLESTVVMMSC